MSFFKDIFTGPDGKTYDPARILWVVGIIAFLAFSSYQVYKTDNFDMVNFGVAYGSLLAAGAAGVRFKLGSEPAGEEVTVADIEYRNARLEKLEEIRTKSNV